MYGNGIFGLALPVDSTRINILRTAMLLKDPTVNVTIVPRTWRAMSSFNAESRYGDRRDTVQAKRLLMFVTRPIMVQTLSS